MATPSKAGSTSKPLSQRVRVLVRPKDQTRVPGAPSPTATKKPSAKKTAPAKKSWDDIEVKMAGRRYVRTAEGSRHFGLPIGSLIGPDIDVPRERRHHGGELTSYTHEELEATYGKERWSQAIGSDGDGWTLRLFGDRGQGVLTYEYNGEHVVFTDNLDAEDGKNMRDWIQTLDAAAEIGQELYGRDDDEKQEYLDDYGYEEGQPFVEEWHSGLLPGEVGFTQYVGVDSAGDIEIGHLNDDGSEDRTYGAAFSPDETEELSGAIDEMWSTFNMKDWDDDEEPEEEEPDEEPDEDEDDGEPEYDSGVAMHLDENGWFSWFDYNQGGEIRDMAGGDAETLLGLIEQAAALPAPYAHIRPFNWDGSEPPERVMAYRRGELPPVPSSENVAIDHVFRDLEEDYGFVVNHYNDGDIQIESTDDGQVSQLIDRVQVQAYIEAMRRVLRSGGRVDTWVETPSS